jgi:hypothetical protein
MTDRAEKIVSIIGGICAIVGSLYNFWNWFKESFRWLVDSWQVVPLAALVVVVCFVLVRKTEAGQRVWHSTGSFLHSIVTLRALVVFLITINAFNFGTWFSNYLCHPRRKTITGNIYYQRCNPTAGLDPVPDVKVSLSEKNLESAPTGADGKFSIVGVPSDFQIHQLTAQLGGVHYLMSYKDGEVNYEAIPRSCERRLPRWEVRESWRLASADECLSETEDTSRIKRRFQLQTVIKPEGRQQAILTVELQDLVNVRIVSAFVLSPSEQSGTYREDMEGLNEDTARRWIFDLPENGLTVQLEICLSSTDSSAPSERHLRTSYELE